MGIEDFEQELSRLRDDMRNTIKWAQTFLGASFAFLVDWLFALNRPLPIPVVIILSATSAIAVVLLLQALQLWVKIRQLGRALAPSPCTPAKRFSLNDSHCPWQGNIRPVVLLTGYFDLLHAGHVAFLQDCKRDAQELLVVGVHSDELTTQQKGPGRPILTLEHRIAALQGVGVVDYVFEADCYYDDPPYRLLEFIKPNYVVLSTEAKESEKKAELRLFLANYIRGRDDIELRTVAVEPPILHTEGILASGLTSTLTIA